LNRRWVGPRIRAVAIPQGELAALVQEDKAVGFLVDFDKGGVRTHLFAKDGEDVAAVAQMLYKIAQEFGDLEKGEWFDET
jgi:hypothetical protein